MTTSTTRGLHTTIALAAAALAVCATSACGSPSTPDPATLGAPAGASTTTSNPPSVRNPSIGNPSVGSTTAGAPTASGPGSEWDRPVGNRVVVPCVDPTSTAVRAALAGVGTDSNGGAFEAYRWTPGTSDQGCPQLEWLIANGRGINDATYESHVLFFRNDGVYLGTATLRPQSYTTVVGSTDTSVSVDYRWLNASDPFCCPQGGPTRMTFTLGPDGRVVPSGTLPPGA